MMTTQTLPDDATLLAMGGPALAVVAHQVGLAPEGAYGIIGGNLRVRAYYPIWYLSDDADREAWVPWNDLAQADAVLRALQVLGTPTLDKWTGTVGHLHIEVGGADEYAFFSTRYVYAAHPEYEIKPLALLRCAVRARCWQVRQEDKA